MRLPLVLLLLLGFGAGASASISVQQLAGGLPHIVGIHHAGDGRGRLFLVSQAGRILIYDGAQVQATPFLDISSLVTFDGEQGLLGLAFHPEYASNGFFYVNYIDTDGDTVIARYQVSDDANVADGMSATVVLAVEQPFTNHNGGDIRFGPDGFLYIALGDGGSGGDPQNHGQRLDSLLGKMLRIDVDEGVPYGIPPTNPFVSTPGARPEIWAYGLRNPWRFTFDALTGDIFIADVGQGVWEEVNFQAAGTGGQNYGWRHMEGKHCYPPPSTICNPAGLTAPILEYSHALGCSVTGGFRYRGSMLTAEAGRYFFADYCTGRIWSAAPDTSGRWRAIQELDTSLGISTFGEDEAGELYLAHHRASGALYRFVPGVTSTTLDVVPGGHGSGRITSSSAAALECGDICGARLPTGTGVTLTATPDAGSTFVSWTGNSDCTDGVVTMTVDRTCTAKFGVAFTDDSLTSGTVVKAIHITELRSRIDALRETEGLAPFNWTTPAIAPAVTMVRAVHITEMRSALGDVYAARSATLPVYTDPMLGAGMPIKAAHVRELRNAVLVLE